MSHTKQITQLSTDDDYLSEFLDFAASEGIEPEQIGIWLSNVECNVAFLRGIFSYDHEVVKNALIDKRIAINALSTLLDKWQTVSL